MNRKPRRPTLGCGTIVVRRARLRGLEERFRSRILPLFTHRTREVSGLLPELHLHGLAEGDFDLALRGLPGRRCTMRVRWHRGRLFTGLALYFVASAYGAYSFEIRDQIDLSVYWVHIVTIVFLSACMATDKLQWSLSGPRSRPSPGGGRENPEVARHLRAIPGGATLAGGTALVPGAVVIADTGSIAFGIDEGGRAASIGRADRPAPSGDVVALHIMRRPREGLAAMVVAVAARH
jgi:hypothetical protein